MGSCISSDNHNSGEHHSHHHLRFMEYKKRRSSSSQAVGRGVAMMMQQASVLVGARPQVDVVALEGKVRKAKAEGRTVTMVNGCLYFDYQLVAYLPPYIDFHV